MSVLFVRYCGVGTSLQGWSAHGDLGDAGVVVIVNGARWRNSAIVVARMMMKRANRLVRDIAISLFC